MFIRRQRVARHTQRVHTTLALQAKTQHDDKWQCQAVGAQLHRLPAISPVPELPAIGVTAQPAKGPAVGQRQLTRYHPGAMGQAHSNAKHGEPDWDSHQQQRTQGKHLGQEISRQQLPGGLPAAFEAVTSAGHGPGSSGPCAAVQGLRIRYAP